MKINKIDNFTILFIAVTAAIPAIHFLLYFFVKKGQPFEESIIKAFIIFISFSVFILSAYLSGGCRWEKNNIIVSPWFGVFVVGSFFLFWVGAAFIKNIYGGIIAIALWGGFLLSISKIVRMFKLRNNKKA
jgi:predicted small integral membrane protein